MTSLGALNDLDTEMVSFESTSSAVMPFRHVTWESNACIWQKASSLKATDCKALYMVAHAKARDSRKCWFPSHRFSFQQLWPWIIWESNIAQFSLGSEMEKVWPHICQQFCLCQAVDYWVKSTCVNSQVSDLMGIGCLLTPLSPRAPETLSVTHSHLFIPTAVRKFHTLRKLCPFLIREELGGHVRAWLAYSGQVSQGRNCLELSGV